MNINEKVETITGATSEPEIQPKTFGGILKNLFIIYGKGYLKFAVPVGIVEGIMIGIALWIKYSHFHVRTEAAAFGMLMLILIIYYILYLIADGLIISIVASYNLSGKSSIRNSMLILRRRLPRLLGALGLFFLFWLALGFVIALFSIIMNVFALIIFSPVLIYFMIKWAFIFQAVIIEGCGPGEAFSRSSELVREDWWRAFGIILVIVVISGGIGYGLAYAFKFLGVYAELISAVISVPIGIVGNTLLYYYLRSRSEYCTVKQAVAELEPGTKTPMDSAPTPAG
jgi:hypothetical protein